MSLAWKSEEADPAMTLRGVFTEVVPHERIVHTDDLRRTWPGAQTSGESVQRV